MVGRRQRELLRAELRADVVAAAEAHLNESYLDERLKVCVLSRLGETISETVSAMVSSGLAESLAGHPERMRRYQPPATRWGSILGPWDGRGYEVDFQGGSLMWMPLRVWSSLMWPLVQRFLFAGMRNSVDWTDRVEP